MMKRNQLIFILLISLLGIYFFSNMIPVKPKFYGDQVFHDEAKIAAQYLRGEISLSQLSIKRAPGPVLFYAIPYFFAHTNNDNELWKWGTAFNFVCIVFATLLLYQSLNVLVQKIHLGIFILTGFIIPIQIYYALSITAETMAFLGCCCYLFGAIHFIQNNYRIQHFMTLIIGVSLLIAARPNSMILVGAIPFFLLIRHFVYRVRFNFTKNMSIAYAIAVLLIAGITFWTKSLPSNTQQSSQENLLLYVSNQGRFQYRTEPWDWRFWDDATRTGSTDYNSWVSVSDSLQSVLNSGPYSFNQIYGNWLITDVKNHPIIFIQQVCIRLLSGNILSIGSIDASKFMFLGLSGKAAYYTAHIAMNAVNIAIIILAVCGCSRLLRHNGNYIFIILPYLALLLFHGIIYMEQRYLFPARPVILFFALFQLHQLIVKKNGST